MSGSQDEFKDEGARPAGPVAAGDPPPPATAQEGVPPTTPPTGEAVEQDFDELLAAATKERDEYLELAKRTKADFENYRKRVAADVQAAQARGKVEVTREVIDAVDNLERALEAAGDGESLAAGVEMVLGGLRETLSRNGVEAVDPKGEKFDPTRHEALSTQPVEGTESGVVVEVLQKGYALGDQLVRPARVVVSS
ncbi:MAG TPA: nucleotide exchange factor GrpE [Solirubrobacterales bacterium]|nr:nucleotide exchange factor GrpE [Solirubrobacterales bacterium]